MYQHIPSADTKVHFDQCSKAVRLGQSLAGPQDGQDNQKESHRENNRQSTPKEDKQRAEVAGEGGPRTQSPKQVPRKRPTRRCPLPGNSSQARSQEPFQARFQAGTRLAGTGSQASVPTTQREKKHVLTLALMLVRRKSTCKTSVGSSKILRWLTPLLGPNLDPKTGPKQRPKRRNENVIQFPFFFVRPKSGCNCTHRSLFTEQLSHTEAFAQRDGPSQGFSRIRRHPRVRWHVNQNDWFSGPCCESRLLEIARLVTIHPISKFPPWNILSKIISFETWCVLGPSFVWGYLSSVNVCNFIDDLGVSASIRILWLRYHVKTRVRRGSSFSQLGLEPNHTGWTAQSLFFLEESCRVKRSDTQTFSNFKEFSSFKNVLPASPNKTSSAQTHKYPTSSSQDMGQTTSKNTTNYKNKRKSISKLFHAQTGSIWFQIGSHLVPFFPSVVADLALQLPFRLP